MEKIILLGMGGHAHSVVDSIEREGHYHIAGFLDPEAPESGCYKEYKVLGNDDALAECYKQGIRHAFIAVGYMGTGKVREHLYEKVKQAGYHLPNIIDPSAVVANDARLGEGVFVGKNAVLNAGAEIGNMCIINTGAIIEHDCTIDEFSHISVGSVLCGMVKVGRSSFVGANATVIQGRAIGDGCIVGAGAVVRIDMEDGMLIKDQDRLQNDG